MSEFPRQPAPVPEPKPKKSKLGMIFVVGGILFLCLCVTIGGILFAINTIGSQVNTVFDDINATLENPAPPTAVDLDDTVILVTPDITPVYTEPANSDPTQAPRPTETAFAEPDMSDFIPSGGLGDDILRASTWGYVFISAAISNCDITDPTKTLIEVIQQPDSAGLWKERWTVTCGDETTRAYDVVFTPESGGGTSIKVEEAK